MFFSENVRINRFWWLYLPLSFLILQIILEISLPVSLLAVMHTENAPHEIAQWVIIGGALAVALAALLKINPRKDKWLFAWVSVAALSCFYVMGEEISWGQHFLNWDTPEYWRNVNDQHETNLHNTSSWLDQKPRLLLFIGIVMGGIIFPLLQKYKPGTLPEKFAIIYPPAFLMPTALLVLGPYLAEKILAAFDGGFFERVSEVQEIYMFYFVLLYMIVLRRRILN